MNSSFNANIQQLHHYHLIVAYDGTNYGGWQQQKHDITIAGILQQRFMHAFQKPVRLVGASRTDAGVHALGQVVKLTTDFDIEPTKLMRALNNILPPDILIRSLTKTDYNFHPQRNVLQKTYFYHVVAGQRPSPFIQRYCYYFPYQLDPEKLQQALNIFIGTHDFRSFCSGYDSENTIRTIDAAFVEYYKRYNVYRITIKGPGFLRYMIRRIVGACLEVASRETLSINLLQQVLAEKDPEQTLPNAPAKGLLLYKINYQEDLRR